MGEKLLEFHYHLWTVEENLRDPVLVKFLCLKMSQMTGLFLWNHSTAGYFWLSFISIILTLYFVFLFFLKQTLLNSRRLILVWTPSILTLTFSGCFLKHLLPATNKSRWTIGMTGTCICLSGISFKSVLKISLLCKMSETMLLVHSLRSSHFYLQFGKSKPVWCLSLLAFMVCTLLKLNKCISLNRKLISKTVHHSLESFQKHMLWDDLSMFIIQTVTSFKRPKFLRAESDRKVIQVEK